MAGTRDGAPHECTTNKGGLGALHQVGVVGVIVVGIDRSAGGLCSEKSLPDEPISWISTDSCGWYLIAGIVAPIAWLMLGSAWANRPWGPRLSSFWLGFESGRKFSCVMTLRAESTVCAALATCCRETGPCFAGIPHWYGATSAASCAAIRNQVMNSDGDDPSVLAGQSAASVWI
jgi:hypothetical protein